VKRARTDTLVTVAANRMTVQRESLRDLRFFKRERDPLTLYWSIVLAGAAAIVEMLEQPLEMRWCREHRDYCDIRAIGKEFTTRRHWPGQVALNA